MGPYIVSVEIAICLGFCVYRRSYLVFDTVPRKLVGMYVRSGTRYREQR